MGSWSFRKGTPGIGHSTYKATIVHGELNIYVSSWVKSASVLVEVEGPFTVQHSDAGVHSISGARTASAI